MTVSEAKIRTAFIVSEMPTGMNTKNIYEWSKLIEAILLDGEEAEKLIKNYKKVKGIKI